MAPNRFWKHYPANAEPPFHKVTHRHDKSIPGCTPAPREGIYRPEDYDEMKAKMIGRVSRFLSANAIGNMMAKQEFFSNDHFREPIFGAFGEKL